MQKSAEEREAAWREKWQPALRAYLLERKSMEVVGQECGVCRERIRQVLLRFGIGGRQIQTLDFQHRQAKPLSEYENRRRALQELGLKKCGRCHALLREADFSPGQYTVSNGRCRECAYWNNHKYDLQSGRVKREQPLGEGGPRVDLRRWKEGRPGRKGSSLTPLIRDMLDAGCTHQEIMQELGCTSQQVSQVKRYYGYPLSTQGRAELPQRDEVEALLREGQSNAEIAAATGVSYAYVRNLRHRLKKQEEREP